MSENKKRRRQEASTAPHNKPGRKSKSSSSASGLHPFKDRLKADSVILASVKQFSESVKAQLSSLETPPTLSDLNLSSSCREVSDLSTDDVERSIERVMLRAVSSILAGEGFSFTVPARSNANQLYVPELDRIVLKDKTSSRSFSNLSTVRKIAITTRVLRLIHELCRKNIHVTKRDLFYTDVKLFKDQSQSDSVLDDVSCMLGCTRSSLNVVASEKGVVVGRLIFSDDGDPIDCTKMGVGGKAIPPNIDRVSDMKTDALFILLVEKDAAFMRLAEDRFYNRFPCIIITAKGQPDVATRRFLRKMKTELKLPVLALVDSDPYGLKILSVYMCGSKNMSYDSANLTTPDIKWLGIRPSDLDKYGIPEQCRLQMTEQDVKTGKDLLEEDFVKKNKGWVDELGIMVKTKQKAEIQALSTFGFQYLSEVYLPLKIQQRDWL
ncbi:DNA topoisomerase 6 subunit A [Aristolochia californica]|uniref:DNA topoisomerase 6 subunit A n=1 Tax=Aristolochia californica TaxID=171875 RepID=UPI0035D61F91